MNATSSRAHTNPRYLVQDSPQTLRQGLNEYYALEPALLEPTDLRDDTRDALLAHDAPNVVFGCDTSARGKLALSRWTLLGAVDALPIYIRGLGARDTRECWTASGRSTARCSCNDAGRRGTGPAISTGHSAT